MNEKKKQEVLKSLMDPEYFVGKLLEFEKRYGEKLERVKSSHFEFTSKVNKAVHNMSLFSDPSRPRGKLISEIIYPPKDQAGDMKEYLLTRLRTLKAKYFEDYSMRVERAFWFEWVCDHYDEFKEFIESEKDIPLYKSASFYDGSPSGNDESHDPQKFDRYFAQMQKADPYFKSMNDFKRSFDDVAEEEMELR